MYLHGNFLSFRTRFFIVMFRCSQSLINKQHLYKNVIIFSVVLWGWLFFFFYTQSIDVLKTPILNVMNIYLRYPIIMVYNYFSKVHCYFFALFFFFFIYNELVLLSRPQI